MRADFLGCYGSAVTETPTFNRLARRGVMFERANASSPFTPTSLWSLLYAEQVHGHSYGMSLKDHFGTRGTIAERFRAAGYRTAAVVGSAQLKHGLGFERGFDLYLDTYSEPSFGNETTLARVLEVGSERLTSEDRRRPYFLYVHFFDPHGPWGDAPAAFRTYAPEDGRFVTVAQTRGTFLPAPTWQSAQLEDAVRRYSGEDDLEPLRRRGEFEMLLAPMYRSEITWSDDVLRRLLAGFKRLGLRDNTIVAVSSDHGIAFAEHYQTTGYVFSLFAETLHVPLVIVGGGLPARRVTAAVSLMDVGPTLLDLAGIAEAHAEGRSLRALIMGSPAAARPVYAEATAMPEAFSSLFSGDDLQRYAPGLENAHAALINGSLKLVHMPPRSGDTFELFDIARDPEETVNIFSADNPVHSTLAARLLAKRGAVRDTPSATAEPEAIERLRALGYMQ